jgi:hypothetical protein
MRKIPAAQCTHFLTVALMLLSGVMVSSCDSTPKVPAVPPEISFTRYQPIYLDVANIEIIEEYKSPMKEPFVEHLLPVSPAEATRAWVKDRMRSVGLNHSLQVIIKDASVVASEPPPPEGVKDYFVGPDRRYDARVEIEMRIYRDSPMSDASITIMATQSNTLSKKASLAERKLAFYHMVSALMESANAELEKQIFKYFTRYIMYAQTP